MRCSATGEVTILDQSDNLVRPTSAVRNTYYDGLSKPKFQTVLHNDGYLTVGGLDELLSLNSFFVIDTNTNIVNGQRVSITFLMRLKLVLTKDGYQVIPVDRNVFVFEFIGVPNDKNPELLAMLKLSNDILATEQLPKDTQIWFINDSELGNQRDYSNQIKPIYGKHFLPKPFKIVYASSDRGTDAINQLFRIADSKAKEFLKKVQVGEFGGKEYTVLIEDPAVKFVAHAIPLARFEMGALKASTGVLDQIVFEY